MNATRKLNKLNNLGIPTAGFFQFLFGRILVKGLLCNAICIYTYYYMYLSYIYIYIDIYKKIIYLYIYILISIYIYIYTPNFVSCPFLGVFIFTVIHHTDRGLK